MTDLITDAIVEAAARAMKPDVFDVIDRVKRPFPSVLHVAEQARRDARAALAAAVPMMVEAMEKRDGKSS